MKYILNNFSLLITLNFIVIVDPRAADEYPTEFHQGQEIFAQLEGRNETLRYTESVIPLKKTKSRASYRCDYKYSAFAKVWYKQVIVPANWFDARLRCALEGASLASPIIPEVTTLLKNKIKQSFAVGFEIFTGFHATFSTGDFYSIEGVPLSEINLLWVKNEPDNLNDSEKCISLNGNGRLADRSCELPLPYICIRNETSIKNTTTCGTEDPEYRLDSRTNSCYKFHTVARNFSRAFLACAAEGSHLAIINSEEEAKVLKELFAKYPAKKMDGAFWKDVAFVGIHDWDERFDWRTIHGQTLAEAGYSKFSPGEPNNSPPGENCGSIYRSGLLNDLWCDRPAPFICEKDPTYPPLCQRNVTDVIECRSSQSC